MKAYTSIEQSKKLAEFLSLESADMCIDCTNPYYIHTELRHIEHFDSEHYPCWSLAALLNIIPKEVEIKGQRYAPCLFPVSNGYWIYKLWYNSNEIIKSPISVYCDNLIDACYELILKLHELKML